MNRQKQHECNHYREKCNKGVANSKKQMKASLIPVIAQLQNAHAVHRKTVSGKSLNEDS